MVEYYHLARIIIINI